MNVKRGCCFRHHGYVWVQVRVWVGLSFGEGKEWHSGAVKTGFLGTKFCVSGRRSLKFALILARIIGEKLVLFDTRTSKSC